MPTPASMFRTQFNQLKHAGGYAEHNLPDGYEIVPAVHKSWSTAGQRILFIIESVDSNDIRAGQLFASRLGERGGDLNVMKTALPNILDQSWMLYQEYLGVNTLTDTYTQPEDTAIGFVNFNAAKYFHYKDFRRTNILLACAKRVQAVVEHMKPTMVVIFGDTAAHYLLSTAPDRSILPWKRGWVQKRSIGQHTCKVMHTLDLDPLWNNSAGSDEEDDDDAGDASGTADLLYYVCRHLCHAFAGKHLHSIKHDPPKIIDVNTIDRFERLYEKLLAATGPIGFDCETTSLEAYTNTFLTQQYAFETNKAYVIVLDHKDTPFTPKQLAYIHGKLAKFWAARKSKNQKEIVGMNLAFDLKVVRAQYDIPVIYHKVWDVSAGEMLLDENIALFNRIGWRVGLENVKTTQGNLRAIAAAYGSDCYFPKSQGGSGSNTFGKDNRATIASVNLPDADCFWYCSEDAVTPLFIREQQIAKADRIRITKNKTYKEAFVRHVVNQMSNTVHAISHMHQNGSHVDMAYMEMLASKSSPLLKVKTEVMKQMLQLPSVEDTNSALLKQKKVAATSLFGGSVSLFDIQKGDSLKVLFFDVLGLKPLRHTSTGQPSVDKNFLNEYAPTNKEAELVLDYRIAMKLHSTYVKGWIKKMKERLDCALDDCLRPSFAFFIVTGRLSSFDPNLQQVPSRGKSAKIIKRAFTPRKNRINMDWDFNASEVRFAAVLAKDDDLRDAFLVGTELRKQFLQEPDPAKKKLIAARLKTEGDLHILNVKRFFGQVVDKNHPLRSAVKAVVFGVLYGKSSATLAKDMELEARYRHRGIVLGLKKAISAFKKATAKG